MERVNYTAFGNGFDTVVLEESFVLNLKTTMSFVEFQMAFAVNEAYPLYTPPQPNEQGEEMSYSYRRGRLFLPNMEQVKWQSRIQPYIDPGTGTVDYGAIDYFYKEGDLYFLAGYWGELEIQCGEPILEIDELKEYQQQNKAAESNSSAQGAHSEA